MTEPASTAQVVVGGTVAALAAADALAARGREVRLFLPRKGVGGGFLPLVREGQSLELGMRVLELRYEGVGAPPPLEEYRPAGEGHRPFVGILDRWVRDLVGDDGLVEIDPPASWLGGRLGPEVLLQSDLTSAAGLVPSGVALRIAQEAAAIAAESGAAGWLSADAGPTLWRRGFDEASLHQHGRTFHEVFLAPFTAKIRPAGGRDVLAALRRKLWVPLFWPRTVAEAFAGRPVGFVPDRPLTVARPGGVGPVVRALLARLRASTAEVAEVDGLTSITREGAGVRVEFADGRVESVHRPVLGLSAGDLFRAAGIDHAPARVRSVLAWLAIRESDLTALPGFVHVLDPDVPAYRVTAGALDEATGTRVLCVELAHDVPPDEAGATARRVVERVGLCADGAPVRELAVFAGPTFTDPTADTVERHAAAVRRWDELDVHATVVGGALAHGYDSFNEQVLQGLQAAEQLA
ncbi:hypothetical protein [Geodermatophilus sp. SYSU D00079]